MAEIIGAVASGLAIVEVVGRLGSGIIKLKRAYDEVENVPDTIQNLLKRLDIIFSMVDQAVREVSDNNPHLQDASAVRRCIMYCDSAFNELAASVDHLLVSIDSTKMFKRKTFRVKVALQQNVLTAHERHLDNVVHLLTLAEAMSLRIQVKSLPAVLLQHMIDHNMVVANQQVTHATEREGSVASSAETSTAVAYDRYDKLQGSTGLVPFQEDSSYPKLPSPRPTFLGSFVSRSSTYQMRDEGSEHETTNRAIRVQLPWWVTRKAWELRIHSGWQYNLRVYNTVPFDSPLFLSIFSGEPGQIANMFSAGMASPFDACDSTTAFQYALRLGYPPVIETFLRSGCQFQPEDTEEALTGYEGKYRDRSSAKDLVPTDYYHCLMMKHNVWDFLDSVTLNRVFDIVSPVTFLTKAQISKMISIVAPDYFDMPIAHRVNTLTIHLARRARSCCEWPDLDAFTSCLWPNGAVSGDDIPKLESQGYSLLYTAAHFAALSEMLRFLVHYARAEKRFERTPYWHAFLHGDGEKLLATTCTAWKSFRVDIMHFTEDLHFRQDGTLFPEPDVPGTDTMEPVGTPLAAVLRAYTRFLPYHEALDTDVRTRIRSIETALRSFLEDLQLSGIDLEMYGTAELRHFKKVHSDDYGRYAGFDGPEVYRRDWFYMGEPEAHHLRLPRLETFEPGPQPDDWVFTWDWGLDRFAGEFWGNIEQHPASMPGSWIEDDEQVRFEREDSALACLNTLVATHHVDNYPVHRPSRTSASEVDGALGNL